MKIILSEIDHIFDCAGGRCCSIVIENQKLFYNVIRYESEKSYYQNDDKDAEYCDR